MFLFFVLLLFFLCCTSFHALIGKATNFKFRVPTDAQEY